MKCPKCGYISFDYNLTCPKCNRDISSEQEKLNLPSFKPHTPSLLGALTGEAHESQSELGRGSAEIDLAHDAEITFDEESSHLESSEVTLPGSDDFELGSEEISFDDISGLALDSGKASRDDLFGSDPDTEEAVEDLDLADSESEDSGFGTDELELDVSGSIDPLDEEPSLDLGETLRLDKEIPRRAGGEITEEKLQFDGELTAEVDDFLDMDEIVLEEVPLGQKPSTPQSDEGKKQSPAQDRALSLDLGDLDLELDLEDSKPQG
jgi:hypothetical protein